MRLGRPHGIDVIAGFNDLSVVHPKHEDTGYGKRLACCTHVTLVGELRDDDFGIEGVVNRDIRRVKARTLVGLSAASEVGPKLIASAQWWRAKGVKGVSHVGCLRIQTRQVR